DNDRGKEWKTLSAHDIRIDGEAHHRGNPSGCESKGVGSDRPRAQRGDISVNGSHAFRNDLAHLDASYLLGVHLAFTWKTLAPIQEARRISRITDFRRAGFQGSCGGPIALRHCSNSS